MTAAKQDFSLDVTLPGAGLPPHWQRRTAAVLQFAGYGLGGLCWWLSGGPGPTLLFSAAILWFALGLAAFGFLAGRYLFLGMAGDCVLDERERDARNRAYRKAYEWSGCSILFALLYHMIAVDAGFPSLAVTDFLTAFYVTMGTALIFLALPGALIAWNEPSDTPAGFGLPAAGAGITPYGRWRNRFLLCLAIGGIAGAVIGLLLP
jgi:hypothetical protein